MAQEHTVWLGGSSFASMVIQIFILSKSNQIIELFYFIFFFYFIFVSLILNPLCTLEKNTWKKAPAVVDTIA